MSGENISLCDLLNLSIGTPHRGAVNFGALHALLHAMLRQLEIREVKTRWRESPPGGEHPDAPVGVTAPAEVEEEGQSQGDAVEPEVQPGTELQERIPSPSTTSTPADGPGSLRSRIHTCEQDVSKALKLIQELHSQRAGLMEERKEAGVQQQVGAAQPESVAAVEKCCHRVDVLEDSVRSLRDSLQRYPHPDELSGCVTWDSMQSALLGDTGSPQKELPNSGAADGATHTPFNTAPSLTSTPSSPRPFQDSGVPAALASPSTETSSRCGRYPETVEALRNIGRLQKTIGELEARVAALEEGNVERSELTHLRQLISNKASQDALKKLTDQLTQQRALIDSLMSDRERKLEETFMSQDTEPASDASDASESACHELRQQISYLRKCVQKLQEDVTQLKITQAAEGPLQDQLDELRGTVPDMAQSLTPQLSGGLEDERDSHGIGRRAERSTVTAVAVDTDRKLSRLEDKVNRLQQQAAADRAEMLRDTESTELVSNLQNVILQLQEVQAECEKLHETTRCLHEDNRQRQSHIEELVKTMEELEEKKADKQMVETEIKADKSALETKVSRLQFDSATEQLSTMFHELLSKVTGHEQDWNQVIDRLSTEMECKLNRIELDSVKKQLEDRWKSIHEKLQAQGPPEPEDAAALRKQLVDRFHCLSCDRPVVKYTPGPHSVKLASSPGFPAHKSLRLFSEHLRQHYRSCGGSHTVTSASQRRLQAAKHHGPPEVDGTIQSEEIDIVGLDGHIYRGRLNAPAIRSTETKLPTISTKDGVRTKDKAKCLTHKPAASPPLQTHSAKSAQSSRSASSSSARDWPVSALGCTSQSSMTPAAAESVSEHHADELVDL